MRHFESGIFQVTERVVIGDSVRIKISSEPKLIVPGIMEASDKDLIQMLRDIRIIPRIRWTYWSIRRVDDGIFILNQDRPIYLLTKKQTWRPEIVLPKNSLRII